MKLENINMKSTTCGATEVLDGANILAKGI